MSHEDNDWYDVEAGTPVAWVDGRGWVYGPEAKAIHDRRARFEAAHARSLEVFGELYRRLAASDHLPADSDACRAADGSCDGSCRG